MKPAQKVLVLGATGMLGHMLFSVLSENDTLETYATARNADVLNQHVRPQIRARQIGTSFLYEKIVLNAIVDQA
jgi:dTDP-4-dehydrorhamnose reductase